MIRIGTARRDYGAGNIFLAARPSGAEYVRQPYIPWDRLAPEWGNAATLFVPWNRVDAYHTFNTVVLNRNPWIVSFESVLPRSWSPSFNRKLFARLADQNCRAILAASQNALLHLQLRNEGHPEFDRVISKARVVYPSVEDNPEGCNRTTTPSANDPLRMVFIGHHFFRKGGDIAVSAYEKLKKEMPLQLTVVSEMDEANYVLPTPSGSGATWRDRMKSSGVTHFSRLPPENVRKLLAQSDLVLLPTLDDSFGYSVVEGMAAGAVPIATSVRAIPEVITHQENGWLIDVATTAEGRLDTTQSRPEDIERGLLEAIRFLAQNRPQINDMRAKGRKTYEARFARIRLAKNLGEVYASALS